MSLLALPVFLQRVLAYLYQGLVDSQNHFWQVIITYSILLVILLYLVVKVIGWFNSSADVAASEFEPEYVNISPTDWTNYQGKIGEALNTARNASANTEGLKAKQSADYTELKSKHEENTRILEAHTALHNASESAILALSERLSILEDGSPVTTAVEQPPSDELPPIDQPLPADSEVVYIDTEDITEEEVDDNGLTEAQEEFLNKVSEIVVARVEKRLGQAYRDARRSVRKEFASKKKTKKGKK